MSRTTETVPCEGSGKPGCRPEPEWFPELLTCPVCGLSCNTLTADCYPNHVRQSQQRGEQ